MSFADPDKTSTGILGNAHNLSAVLCWYAAFFKTDDNNTSLWDPVLFSDINKVVITLYEAFKHAELAHYK
jgi:pyridoxal/pyridoxine/pyridoxamine kinase